MQRVHKIFAALLLVFVLAATGSTAAAESRTFTAKGNMIVNDREAIATGREYAVQNAKANACMEAGTFVSAYTKTSNGLLSEDDVEIVTSDAIQVVAQDFAEPLEEIIRGDSIAYNVVANITAVIDTAELEKVVAQYMAVQSSLTDEQKRQQAAARAEVKKLQAAKAAAAAANAQDQLANWESLATNLLIQAVNLEVVGEYGKALALLQSVENLGLQNKEILYQVHLVRGCAYYSAGQYDQAIASCTQAIALNTGYAEAYNNRGNAYCDLGQYDKGIADYDQAIALNGSSAEAYHNRGLAYCNLGEFAKGIADYDQAIKLNAKDPATYHSRGSAYFCLGEYDKAVADYTQAIELDNNYKDPRYFRGRAYMELGQYELALADFYRLLSFDPNDAEAQSAIQEAQTLLQTGGTVSHQVRSFTAKGFCGIGSQGTLKQGREAAVQDALQNISGQVKGFVQNYVSTKGVAMTDEQVGTIAAKALKALQVKSKTFSYAADAGKGLFLVMADVTAEISTEDIDSLLPQRRTAE